MTTATQPSSPFTFVNPFTMTPSYDRLSRFAGAATDTASAEVGQTPKRVVWKRGPARLYRYVPRATTVRPVPLLLVHSLVSRSYILDLIPGNSFIEHLVDQGFDVYLTDWGVPTSLDANRTLEDYVLDFLPKMVATVQQESGSEAVSMLGYCMGGLLALMYAAMHPDSPVRNLISLATPVDFDQMGLQALWGRHFNPDRLVDVYGNVPAEVIRSSFRMLKPASEVSPVRYLSLWQKADDDNYIAQYRAFDRWTQEHIPFPGAAFRQTARELVQKNGLVRGTLTLDGHPVDLGAIRQSFLGIAAEGDHIVPLASTTPQQHLVGSEDRRFITLPGGHVGLAAGRNARKSLWPRVVEWLEPRSTAESVEYGLAAD